MPKKRNKKGSKKKPDKSAQPKGKMGEVWVTNQFKQRVRSLAPPFGDGTFVGLTKTTGLCLVRMEGRSAPMVFGTVALEFLAKNWKELGLQDPGIEEVEA